MDLVDALEADSGVVSVVGAGGKKSTMYRLAEAIERAVVTATVRIPPFESHVSRVMVTPDPREAIEAAGPADWPLGLVPERSSDERFLGYERSVIDDLSELDTVDTILVKADGARMRKFKAPNEREPQIPSSTTVVVPVVSAHVIGEVLSEELVHRVDRVSAISGLSPGRIMTPEAIAEVIASPKGGHKGVPADATVLPVINMVDDGALERRAHAVAQNILAQSSVSRVLLTQLNADEPVIDIVE